MCNLYGITKGQQAIRAFTRAVEDVTGNLPSMPGIYPDYPAPIVRNQPNGRQLTLARWGMPSPAFALKGRKSDPGVTNVRNVTSPHWRRWLGVDSRCVVPFTSFAEHEVLPDGSRPPIWFAFSEDRPLACFAGIWTHWTSVRKVKEGETANDLFAFLTTEPAGPHVPPEGNACDPADAGRDRPMDDSTDARSFGASAAASGQRPHRRQARGRKG